MNKIKYIFQYTFVCVMWILFMGHTSMVFAMQSARPVITSIETDTVWDKSGSPYNINNEINIINGATLTIGPGVSVRGIRNAFGVAPSINVTNGSLVVHGDKADRVSIGNLGGIFLTQGHLVIERADISSVDGIYIKNSDSSISSSTFSQMSRGLDIENSAVSIHSSWLKNITNAILVELGSSTVNISNSSIAKNDECALCNYSLSPVMATNNWWGSPSGPTLVYGANSLFGPADYEPWLTSEPLIDPEDKPMCCSSILFLPGLEGSRLLENNSGLFGFGTIQTKLWEPFMNQNVKDLYLDSTGTSTNKKVYVGGAIDNALGVFDIYGKFMNFLSGLQKNGVVNEWSAFGYDWRKPIAEVVAGPVVRGSTSGTTTDSLLNIVSKLSEHSKTGKVTLIAHSNGGLVAKYLVKVLADMGKSDIIDKVISIAVPYLGTPQAISGLLHGDNQAIAGGLILKQTVARQFGLNMPSAYSLLPSAEYFSKVMEPTIAFAATSTQGLNNGIYPKNIISANDQTAFITDQKNARKTPVESDLNTPAKGNTLLSTAADILHGILDPMEWPRDIIRYAIVGWNNNTTKAVSYGSSLKCDTKGCKSVINYSDVPTKLGDGTVVTPSAAYNSGTVTSADLGELSKQEGKQIEHTSIMGASSTLNVVSNMIQTDSNAKQFPLPAGYAWGEPDYSKDTGLTGLVVSTHSPVELHVYDDKGRHTGIIPPTQEMIDEVTRQGGDLSDMVQLSENNIIGANFKISMGDNNDAETTISLPDDGRKYRVEIVGAGVGTFEYDVDRYVNNTLAGHAVYANMPVNPLTIASTTLQVPPTSALSSSSPTVLDFSSTMKPLSIDIDGNGTVDLTATSTKKSPTSFNPKPLLDSLRKTLLTLLGPNSTKSLKFINRFNHIDQLMNKGNIIATHDYSAKIEQSIGHLKMKGLNDKKKQQVIDSIDAFLAQYE